MTDLISRDAAKQAVHDTIASASTVLRVLDEIDKLRKRYPGGFDEDASIHREV